MSVIEEVCTITAKGQTTVPKAIRRALGISYGGRIAFRVEDGTVSVHAAAELKEDPALAHIPVVAVTAFAMKGDETRMLEGGCEAYLAKPISVSALLGTVRRLLGDEDDDGGRS